jgi:predicted ATPase/DNA-binding SARP family transcriptional activator
MARPDIEPPGAELTIQLMGGFRVYIGPLAVDDAAWRWRKARAVVKLLALSPGYRLHREQVLDRLWPGQPPETATNNLHQAMHLARRGVETLLPDARVSSWLQVQGDTVLLDPRNHLQVDADIFEAAATSALRTMALSDLESAAHLYTGELLPEDRYESWTEARRDALRRLHLSLLVTLATQHEARGNFARAITTLEQVLAGEPAHEDAHIGLMRAHALAGHRHAALEQYRRLKIALKRDLDAEPGPASSELYHDIRAGRYPTGAPVSGPQPMVRSEPRSPMAQALARSEPEAAALPGNLPAMLTSFVGRKKELATLRVFLNTTRLLTITGPGGGGKTRLALALVEILRDDFHDGAWWIDLAPVKDPHVLASEVATGLCAQEQRGRSVLQTLLDHVGTRRLLLVFDNCEHLLDACAKIVEALLRAGPAVRIIATSREGLGTAGEVLWPVPPMALPASARPSVEESLQSDAVQLFVARARVAHPAFAFTEDNAVEVADLCRRLDGLPLAIELAAARTRHLSVDDILSRLEDRFRLLVGPRVAPDRHRSLRAALDWSYDLLSSTERLLFNRLSVFPGSFALEGAEAICADEYHTVDVLDALSRLIDQSLVTVEEVSVDSIRYRLLESMRRYGQDRLLASGESVAVFTKHRDYFLALAEEADRHTHGPEWPAWYQRLEVEHDNLRAALAWSFERKEVEAAARLTGALASFWLTRSHWNEGFAWCQRALAAAPNIPLSVRARALCGSALMAGVVGDLALAERQFQESVALAREAGDQVMVWQALNSLGYVYLNLRDNDRATPILEESLVLAREAGDKGRMAASLMRLAAAVAHEDFERAFAMREDSLAMARETGNTWVLHLVLGQQGAAASVRGDYQRAAELITESRQVSQAIGDKVISALRLAQLGGLAAIRGEFNRARALFDESVAEFRRLSADYFGMWAKEEYAHALLSQGDCAQAEALCNECLPVARRAGARGYVASLLRILGIIAFHRGELDHAEGLLQESLELFRQMKSRLGVAACLTDLGTLVLQKGDIEQALAHHREGLRLKRPIPHRLGITRSLQGLAAVAVAAGRPGRAARLLGAAEALHEVIEAPLPPVEQPIWERDAAAAREALGDEAFAAALAEGRTMTMEQAVEEALDTSLSDPGTAPGLPSLHRPS